MLQEFLSDSQLLRAMGRVVGEGSAPLLVPGALGETELKRVLQGQNQEWGVKMF